MTSRLPRLGRTTLVTALRSHVAHPRVSIPKRAFSTPQSASPKTYTREYTALGVLAAGFLGWYLYPQGTTQVGSSSRAGESETGHVNLKRVYGGKDEIAAAISELRAALSEESVSTNPEELKAHGYSHNSYHGGE
jgi:hypothetical protein